MATYVHTSRKTIIVRAESMGLWCDYYNPKDGKTRYRFFKKTLLGSKPDYFSGEGMFTAIGVREAAAWLDGYGAAKYTW